MAARKALNKPQKKLAITEERSEVPEIKQEPPPADFKTRIAEAYAKLAGQQRDETISEALGKASLNQVRTALAHLEARDRAYGNLILPK